MRLLMYDDGTGRRPGVLIEDGVVDLNVLARARGESFPPDLLGIAEGGDWGLEQVRRLLISVEEGDAVDGAVLPLSDVRLLAPLDPPRGNVIAIGRNYTEHAEEMAGARSEEAGPPTVFTKAQTSITGPYDDVVLDTQATSQVDWEAELAAIVGRRALDVPAEQAMDYVFGYTVVNDVSARDVQYGWGGQFFKGKSYDTFCPMGPWIVTADEMPDPQNLQVECRINGQTKQSGNTRAMIHPIAELIARLSRGMTLLPGTIIATGTPPGVGYARKPPEFLQAGDVMETEVEGIGLLRNRIVSR